MVYLHHRDFVSLSNVVKKSTFARWSPNGEAAAAVISNGGLMYVKVS